MDTYRLPVLTRGGNNDVAGTRAQEIAGRVGSGFTPEPFLAGLPTDGRREVLQLDDGGAGGGGAGGGPPAASQAPEASLGSPLKFKFTDKDAGWSREFTIDPKELGVKQTGKATWEPESAKLEREILEPIPDTPFWIKGKITGGFGLEAGYQIGFTDKIEPFGIPAREGTFKHTAAAEGSLNLTASAKASMSIGVLAGVPGLLNVSGNLSASLEAKGETTAAMGGSATRVSDPTAGEWGDWTGQIKLADTKMAATLSATAEGTLEFQILFVDGTFTKIELGKCDLAELSVRCLGTADVPSGGVFELAEPKAEWRPESCFAVVEESPDVYYRRRRSGAEGAGPEGYPEPFPPGAGGAPPAGAGGGGGAPPT